MAKDDTFRRTELRFRRDDAMVVELEAEAAKRGVELQQHITDLLRARHLARRGESLHDLLWMPGSTPPPPVSEQPAPAGPQAPTVPPAASAVANTWLDMQADDD